MTQRPSIVTDDEDGAIPIEFDNGPRFGRVPEWLIESDVKDASLRVYVVLQCKYGQFRNKIPGIKRLGEQAGKGRTQLLAALKDLERVGALRRTHRYKPDGSRTTDHYAVAYLRPFAPLTGDGISDRGLVRDSEPTWSEDPDRRGSAHRTAYVEVDEVEGVEVDPPPPFVVKAEDARSARAIREEEEIQEQDNEPQLSPDDVATLRAAEFLATDLPAPWRLSPPDAIALAGRLHAVASARGWAPDRHLLEALTHNPGGIYNYPVVLRMRIEQLPMRHARPAPAADRVCIDCGRPHPNLYDNGVCPNCIRTDDRAPAPINLRDLIQPTTGHPKP
jgi:hypothetical protein